MRVCLFSLDLEASFSDEDEEEKEILAAFSRSSRSTVISLRAMPFTFSTSSEVGADERCFSLRILAFSEMHQSKKKNRFSLLNQFENAYSFRLMASHECDNTGVSM